MRDDAHNYIALAQDYAESGQYVEALNVLSRIVERTSGNVYPMIHYYQGYYNMKCHDDVACDSYYRLAEDANPSYCFPNSIQDYIVLKHVTSTHENDSKAPYYLGNLLFDKKRHDEAVSYWEKSVALNDTFATVHRNLALAYFNKQHKPDAAHKALEKAFALNISDARVFYELDQLYKKLNFSSEQRLATLEQHKELVITRDDLYLEYITLHNDLNRHEEVITLIMNRHFHPWEGGEGKVPAQYVLARVELAKMHLQEGRAKEAIEQLLAAKQYPLNINEGKLAGVQENNINYYLGMAHQQLVEEEQATAYFTMASQGLDEPTSAMYYNDQPPHMIFYQGVALRQLGDEKAARSRFNKLVDYGEEHIFLSQKIDYFAVSLPDFLVFDEDLNKKNHIHCYYMMGLGHLGLGHLAEAVKNFQQALELEPNHQGATLHLELAL